MSGSSLTPFGFNYVPIPNTNNLPAPSPDCIPNEGQQPTNHGYDCDNSTCATPGDGLYWGSDGDIATVASGKLDSLKTSTNPWCVVASFVNPHDIGVYPAYFSTPANGTGSWTANHFTPEYPYFAPNGSFLSLNPVGLHLTPKILRTGTTPILCSTAWAVITANPRCSRLSRSSKMFINRRFLATMLRDTGLGLIFLTIMCGCSHWSTLKLEFCSPS